MLLALATAYAPTNWMYSGAIDPASVQTAPLRFRTVGAISSEPVDRAWADHLACGEAGIATLRFEDGALVSVDGPPCVEDRAWETRWDLLVAGTRHALVTLDVPEALCCSTC